MNAIGQLDFSVQFSSVVGWYDGMYDRPFEIQGGSAYLGCKHPTPAGPLETSSNTSALPVALYLGSAEFKESVYLAGVPCHPAN